MARAAERAAEPAKTIVFADESGDNGSRSIDPDFPLFVLALCLFDVDYYIHKVCPQLQEIKFKYFAHDGVIFHERDIRKQLGPFSILREMSVRTDFQKDLSLLIDSLNFHIFAVIIDKRDYVSSSLAASDMYSVAMEASLRQLGGYLDSADARVTDTAMLFESRGTQEDRALENAFIHATTMGPHHVRGSRFTFHCIAKRSNSLGLQLSDLVARPLGVATLRPDQPNRAHDIILRKIQSLETVSTIEARTPICRS